MPKTRDKLLADVMTAGAAVQSFMRGKTKTDLENDLLLISAVERQLEIAGEAVRQLRDGFPEVLPHITDHSRIVAFRNVLAHGYDSVDSDVVWQVTIDGLPKLMAEVEQLRASQSKP